MAVVKSGCTVDMVVVSDIEDDVTLYDRGRNRSASDALTLSGIYSTSKTASIARLYLYENTKDKNATYSESRIRDFHIEHAESIQKAIGIVGKGSRGINVRTAYFLTAILNAYECGVPSDTLKRFTKIVKTGFYEKENEVAAVIIRNDIVSGIMRGYTITDAVNHSCMIENAIKDFVAGYVRKKTYKNTTARVYKKREGVTLVDGK